MISIEHKVTHPDTPAKKELVWDDALAGESHQSAVSTPFKLPELRIAI